MMDYATAEQNRTGIRVRAKQGRKETRKRKGKEENWPLSLRRGVALRCVIWEQ